MCISLRKQSKGRMSAALGFLAQRPDAQRFRSYVVFCGLPVRLESDGSWKLIRSCLLWRMEIQG